MEEGFSPLQHTFKNLKKDKYESNNTKSNRSIWRQKTMG